MILELCFGLLICHVQELEGQRKSTDENRMLLQTKLKEKEAKAESIQGILNGNEVHIKLKELKQKLFHLQQYGIKLQEGNVNKNCPWHTTQFPTFSEAGEFSSGCFKMTFFLHDKIIFYDYF
jgi:hypothetical protein